MRAHLGLFLVIVMCLVLSASARADLLVSSFDNGPFGSGVRKFRESDGTYLGNAAVGGETLPGERLGPDGRLYITSNNLGSGVIDRFDWTTGQFLGHLVTQGQNGYQDPGEFVFGADGNVYATSDQVASGGTTGVMKFNGVTGAYLGLFVAPGSGGLGTPSRILTMPAGDLLVGDGQRYNRYDKSTGAFVSNFITPNSSSLGQATYGPDGNVYVLTGGSAVARYNGANGAFIDTFVPPGPASTALGFGNDGNLYVTGPTNDGGSVRRYDGTSGAFIDTFVAPTFQLTFPTGVLFTPEPSSLSVIASAMILLVRRARKRSRVRSTPADPAFTPVFQISSSLTPRPQTCAAGRSAAALSSG